MSGRDPCVDPRAGDVLSNGRRAVLVTAIDDGDVLCLRYPGPEPCVSYLDAEPIAVALLDFRIACTFGAVLVLAEGLP